MERIKSFTKSLKFDKNLRKWKAGDTVLDTSVSKLLSTFTEAVDFDNLAYYLDSKRGLPQGTTKKLWGTKRQLSVAKGNKTHLFMQLYPFYKIEPDTEMEKAVKSFFDTLPTYYHTLFTELPIFHEKCLFIGTIDIVIKNSKTGRYVIVDIKTNDDLFKNYKGKKLLHPFEFMLDMPYSKYIIQLTLYKAMLEQIEGVEVEEMWIVQVKQDGTYVKYVVPDVKDTLKVIMPCL